MKDEKDWTYRSLHREREYEVRWYSALWRVLRPVMVALTVAVIVIGIGAYVWNKGYNAFFAPVEAEDDTARTFEISSGQSLTRVAGNLEEAGLIHSKTVFKYYCDFAGMGQKIQTGTYTLRRSMSMTEIADLLTTGDGNPLVRNITLIPGESIEDFARELILHRLFSALAGEHNHPAQCQRLSSVRSDFDRNLIGSTANTSCLYFQYRHNVVHRSLEHLKRRLAGLLFCLCKSSVHDLLCYAFLAVKHNSVDQLRNNFIVVQGIC